LDEHDLRPEKTQYMKLKNYFKLQMIHFDMAYNDTKRDLKH